MSFLSLLETYSAVYLDLIPASIIALAVRIAPGVDRDDYLTTLEASLHKEITASVSRFTGATLNFQPILSSHPVDREIPFSDRFAPNPEVASDTYQLLCQVRSRLSNMLVYPSLGTKTVGRRVTERFWDMYRFSGSTFKHQNDDTPFVSSVVTPADCLRLYEETGGMIDGPVEMRHAWTYNQLVPRVYFARGGDVIQVSQYLQPIINMVIDALPETHRLNRFAPPKDPLDDLDVEVIYDYASFTSTLDTVVPFVDALADFFDGTLIRLVDVRSGIVTQDLGELFREYNRQCNTYIDFDTTRVLAGISEDSGLLTHTCGMLGVEGNIFLATLLHGIHLRFISGTGRSRCVGDDARLHYGSTGYFTKDDKDWLSWMLQGIGDINAEKIAYFERDIDPLMQAYRYVKRPLSRDQDMMVEGVLLTIPSLMPLFPAFDEYHTIRESDIHPCRITFKSIIRLLDSLYHHSLRDTGEDDYKALVAHVRFLQTELIRKDPKGEHAPIARSGYRSRYHLPAVDTWGKVTYREWLLGDLEYDEVVRFLRQGGEDGVLCDGRLGSEMVKETSKGRSFLTKMGYLREEMLFDEVSLEMIGIDQMRIYLAGEYKAVKHYYVLRDIPAWYAQLPNVL